MRTSISSAVVVLFGLWVHAATLPPANEWQTSGAPLSAPGDPFDLSGITNAASVDPQAPVIAEWNRTCLKPNETFTLTGLRFTNRTGIDVGSDVTVWLYAGDAGLHQCRIWQVRDQTLMAAVPASVPFGMYLVWVENDAGASAPIALNRPVHLWLGPLGNTAAPGGMKRVFGKNLSHDHDTLTSYVYIDGSPAEVTKVEPYAVWFRVPEGIGAGSHEVHVHSGHGGEYGFGGPVELVVGQPWQRGSDQVAVSPSGGDDRDAIQSAIDQMSGLTNGGTVRLEAGTYQLTGSPVEMKDKVRLAGAGKAATIINLDFSSNQMAGILLYGNHTAIESLTVHKVCASCLDYGPFKEAYPDGRDDIQLRSIRVSADAGTDGGRCLVSAHPGEVVDCEFNRELSIGGTNWWIHDNVFYGGPYWWTEGCIGGGGAQTVVENNHFETRTWPDQGGNRNYMDYLTDTEYNVLVWAKRMISVGAGNENWYIAHNTSTDVAVDDNKGEMILFHGLNSRWFAQVASNSERTLTIRTDGLIDGNSVSVGGDPAPAATSVPDGIYWDWAIDDAAYLQIVGGTGVGQSRRVESHTSTTITVADPWRLAPSSDSKITLSYQNTNLAVYRNEMNAFPQDYRIGYSASNAVQFDGNTWHSAIDGNRSNRTYSVARICGEATSPSYWNEVRDHEALWAYSAGLMLDAWNWSSSNAIGPWLLGNAFRDNTVTVSATPPGAASYHSSCFQSNMPSTDIDGEVVTACLFENNVGTGGASAFGATVWSNVMFRDNAVSGSASPGAWFSSTASPVLVENDHPGDASQDGGAGLLMPLRRVVRFDLGVSQTTDSIVIPVVNGGVQPVTWSASTLDSWIDVSVAGGATLSAQASGGLLKVRVTRQEPLSGPVWGSVRLASEGVDTVVVGVVVAPGETPTVSAMAGRSQAARLLAVGPAPSPTFTYEVSRRTDVRLSVWDVRGRVVYSQTLCRQQPGRYQQRVPAPGSGAYILGFQAGELPVQKARLIVR